MQFDAICNVTLNKSWLSKKHLGLQDANKNAAWESPPIATVDGDPNWQAAQP